MAGFYKQWMIEKQEKDAMDYPDFPDFMTREEMFRDLDREYEEWCEKQKIESDNLYASQINCNSMETGNICSDANCLQCKEYINQKTNTNVRE